MAVAFLGLGANLGGRVYNLERAVLALTELGEIARSRWYETAPVDMPGAPWFLNGVVRLLTRLTPERLLQRTQAIERQLGRGEADHAGPRKIDIDILLYDQRIMNDDGLVIPHPQLHLRAFVLVPLAELAPDVVHPVLGRTVSQLLAGVDQTGVMR